MNSIKNIIFDLGAVIIDIDLSLTVQAFADLAPSYEENIRQNLLQTSFFHDFEKGRLSNQAFYDGIREQIASEVSDIQIKQAWNALLLEIPEQRITLLHHLRKQYRTFILSNTNQIHVAAIEQQYPLSEWVEKVYYSCDMDARKPDAEIYEQVLSDADLQASETLFIDDNLENIRTAEQLGLRVRHLWPEKQEVGDFFEQDQAGMYHYKPS